MYYTEIKGNYSLFCGLNFQDRILIWPWEVVKTLRKASLCLHVVNFFFNLFSSSWSSIFKRLKYVIQYFLFMVVFNAHGVFLFSETISFLWYLLCVVLFCVQICNYSVKFCHMYTKFIYGLLISSVLLYDNVWSEFTTWSKDKMSIS